MKAKYLSLRTKNILLNDTDKMRNKYRFLDVIIAHSFSKFTYQLDSFPLISLSQRFSEFLRVFLFCFFCENDLLYDRYNTKSKKRVMNRQVDYMKNAVIN